MKVKHSDELRALSHSLIPGGCHTYAKGDDQYPQSAPAFIERGEGCHVWDPDGNEFIEYGMGLRAVTLGHGFPAVVDAAAARMRLGTNFNRPSPIEVECAQEFLGVIDGADQVKFTKDGSTATTAAVRLARAQTGRDMVAICRQPFLSYDDWFIGASEMSAGIPQAVRDLTLEFDYNDIASLERLFDEHAERIACVILEPTRTEDPLDGFLDKTLALCRRHGAVSIFDENITGFRFHIGGGQKYYGVTPDLSVFGKALANGFALSALAGKRELMELGGLRASRERVFLLSTTHGGETHALAAGIATIGVYKSEPVVETLFRQGERLEHGLREVAIRHGVADRFGVMGKGCNLLYYTLDPDGKPSQSYRTLFLQEILARGILAPSFIVSYSHSDEDIDRTIEAVDGALAVYRRALENGTEGLLVGPPSKIVLRKFS